MKSKDKELLNAKSSSYKSNKDLEYLNTNIKSNILSIKKEMESVQSNHQFSIASTVDTAKVKERNILRAEMKHINVSSTVIFSQSYLLFFHTNLICHNHIQVRERNLQASMDKHVQDNDALIITVAGLNNVSSTALFSQSYILFFLTHLICHKDIQSRVRKLQAWMDKQVRDNDALTITVAGLNARVSALGDSLKDQRMTNTRLVIPAGISGNSGNSRSEA